MYYVLMSLIGFACIVLGWDSLNAIAIYQLSIAIGGMVLGHVITEALNQTEED